MFKDIKKNDKFAWPLAQKEFLEDKQVNIVIQINGKKSLIKIQKNLDEKALLENVKKDKKISISSKRKVFLNI